MIECSLPTEMQSVNVSLVRASKSDEGKLGNLLHLYVHDFSEFLGMKPSEEGRFSYPALPRYLSEPNRAAFVIRCEGDLVGFAFVSQGSVVSGDPAVFDLAEFFVVRGVRRRGLDRLLRMIYFARCRAYGRSGSLNTTYPLSSSGET
jgi:GNAT superfamily N-acetyltransferase